MNAEAASWNGLIDRLDEAAVADGGGPITALAAVARTPARSFLGFVQGAVGTTTLADPAVRAQISNGLGQLLDDPSIIPSAARRYYETHSAGEMAADAYVGATGLLTGNAASSTVVRGLNKLPVLGADVGDLAIAGRLSAGAMARAGDHSTLRQTGGGSGVDPADALYSLIRSSDNDVATVARNTGFKPSNIQKIKDHIFYNEHLLDRYVNQGIKAEIGRFQSDLDQAKAWLRLVNNQYSSKDITWLKHEIAERWYELRHRAGYSESHNAAERRWPGNPWRD